MRTIFFPPHFDNSFKGHKLALWLFGFVIAVKILQSLVVMLDGYSIAISADSIPLDTYPPEAARTVVTMFALVGWSLFLLYTICVVALIRYRSAIPALCTLLILDFLARRVILYVLPITRSGGAGGFWVNFTLVMLLVVALVLSLWKRKSTVQ